MRLSITLLEFLALMVWIGGLTVILIVVIPAVFNTLEMEAGGRLLRNVFSSYNIFTGSIVILMIGMASFRMWQYPKAPKKAFRVSPAEQGLLLSLVIVTILLLFILGPKVTELQEVAFLADTQEARKIAYDNFFRIHWIVRFFHLMNGGLAISLLVVRIRQWIDRGGNIVSS